MNGEEKSRRILKRMKGVTIILDRDLKEAAEEAAREQGLSLSMLVRLLLLHYLETRQLPVPRKTLAEIKGKQA